MLESDSLLTCICNDCAIQSVLHFFVHVGAFDNRELLYLWYTVRVFNLLSLLNFSRTFIFELARRNPVEKRIDLVLP